MAKFKIYSKDGQSVRYEGCPKYNGVYLKVSYLEFTSISSPVPIDWHVGDYIDYPRTGLRYTLRSAPAVRKTAKSGQTGDAFTYPNVQFMAQTQDLVVAPFRDLVPGDNGIHFSTQQSVSTYENAYGIAARIQACLDDMFPGVWSVEIYEDLEADFKKKISEAVDFSISGASCLEACDRMYETWGIGWTHYKDSSSGKDILLFGRPNTRDTDNTTSDFVFGPGQGLTAIKRSTANTDELGTRLYVYGSTKNMLPDYYKGLDIYMGESVDIQNLMIPLSKWGVTDGKPDAKKAFLEASPDAVEEIGLIPKTHYFDGSDGEEIYPTLVGMTIGDVKAGSPDYYPNATAWPDNAERVDEIEDAHNPQDDGYSGNSDGDKYKSTEIVSFTGRVRQEVALSSHNRPGSPQTHSVRIFRDVDMSAAAGDQLTIEGGTEGYIEDVNDVIVKVTGELVLELGGGVEFKENVTFTQDDSEGKKFRFTLPTVTAQAEDFGSVGLVLYVYVTSVTLSANSLYYFTINGNAFTIGTSDNLSGDFTLTLKQIGFNIANRASLTTEGLARIFMKDGMNAGRSFYVRTCEYVEDGDKWLLGMYRTEDESTGMRYPNATFPINPGDHFVLLDIAMPELYIDAAMQRLYDKGMEMLNDISRLKPFYEPEVDAKVMVEQERVLREGMYMRLTDTDVAGNSSEYVLIDTLTVNEGDEAIPTYKVGLREYKKRSFQESTNSAINDLGNKVSGGTIESKPTTETKLKYSDLADIPMIDGTALIGDMASYDDLGLINKTFFELVNIGTEETPTWAIKAKYGLYSEQFISARGADPEAGGGGMDIDAMWAALAAATGEKINASHIPGLSSLSGKLANSQLENSAMTIAGKTVSLGESITASEIAEAIGKASPSALGLVKTGYESSGNNYAVQLDSEGRMFVNVDIEDYFGIDDDGNVFVKDNRGFYSNSFLSARGADPEAGGGGGVDMEAVWAALAAGTSEQINLSHLPSIPTSKISGLESASVGYASSAGTADRVGNNLTVKNDGGVSGASDKIYNGSAAVTINIPTSLPASDVPDWAKQPTKPSYTFAEIGSKPTTLAGYGITDGVNGATASGNLTAKVTGHSLAIGVASGYEIPSMTRTSLWDKICALFDIDADGNVYVTDNRGFYGNSFISARGADPEAGQGGTGGLDIDAMWDALATSGAQKIDASHIPALGLLSGTVSNAQLANSSITVAGVEVPLGGAVTTAQIATALTTAGYKLTDTTYGLATDTVAGLVKIGYLAQVGAKNYGVKLNSLGQMYVSVPWTDTVTTLASLGITATAAEINKLDGLATTAAELGYVHGVTSSIQTQLNSKANASALASYALKDGSNAAGIWQNYSKGIYASETYPGYVLYNAISNDKTTVGSTDTNFAWGTPKESQDSRFGNGQILRLVWAGNAYYTDIFCAPNTAGTQYGLQWRQIVNGAISGGRQGGWRLLLDDYNYKNYTVTKTGDGASGTWAIDISGNAATATKLAASRTLWGQPDDGSGNVSGSLTGVGNITGGGNLNIIASTAVILNSGSYTAAMVNNVFRPSGNSGGQVDLGSAAYPWRNLYASGAATIGASLTVGGNIQASGNLICGTTITTDPRNSFRSRVFGNSTAGFRIKEVRTDISVEKFCSIYGAALAWAGNDTHGWLAVGFEANTKLAYIGSGNADKINWSEQLWHSGNSNLSTVHWAVNNLTAAGQVSADNGFVSSKNNTYALTDANTLTNGILAVSTKIVGHDTVQPMITWSNNVSSYGFITRYSISSVRPYDDSWGRMRLAVGANDTGTLIGCYLDIVGNGFVSISKALQVGTDATISGNLTTSGTIYSATGIWSSGWLSFSDLSSTSDRRFKDGIAPLDKRNALSVIHALKPSTWTWNALSKVKGRSAGFVAQDVAGVLPDAIREIGDDKHLALNYQMLHAYEVAALQEHDDEIGRLRTRVAELERQLKEARTWQH